MPNMNENPKSVLEIFISNFSEFSDKVYQKLSETEEYKSNAQLYHYTSLQSFQKIIENQSFRATSIYMLNDPNELVSGFDQILNWFLEDINQKLSAKSYYKSFHKFPAFVFSLTELNDNMHFWEKYGDKYRGIRIGFTPENIIRYWRTIENIDAILAPVIYQNYENRFIGPYADDFIDFKHNFIQKINNYISQNGLDEKDANQLAYCSSLIASLIKRKEWEIEKEWRIVCIPGGYVHESIIGDFSSGGASVKLENKSEDTLALLTNRGHDGLAHKDVLEIGPLAGNIEFIKYTIQLLFKKQTGCNYFNDNISQSAIVTR